MSHYTATKPFFFFECPSCSDGMWYSAIEPGNQIATELPNIEEFDTEDDLAARVDDFVEQPGWYWDCQNRIPYPPNPNPWDKPIDCGEEPEPEPEPERPA